MAKITTATTVDAVPNLNVMVRVVTLTDAGALDDDYVDMADYGYTTVYMAMAVTAGNVATTSTISDSTKVNLPAAAAMDLGRIFVVGV